MTNIEALADSDELIAVMTHLAGEPIRLSRTRSSLRVEGGEAVVLVPHHLNQCMRSHTVQHLGMAFLASLAVEAAPTSLALGYRCLHMVVLLLIRLRHLKPLPTILMATLR